MKLNRNIKIFINYFLGPLLFLWLSWSIYRQIIRQPDLGTAWLEIKASFHSPMIFCLAAVFLLMPLNWFMEALKWRLAVKEVQRVSLLKACMAVLSGVSFSVSTPNRVGEYLGRVLYMNEGNRLKTISLTIVCSISQLIITLVMGLLSLLVLKPVIVSRQLVSPLWMDVILYGSAGVILLLTFFYFRLSALTRWAGKLPGARRFLYLVEALEHFDATILWRLLSLSLVRFFIFILQYYLLFVFFRVDMNWWQVTWTISLSFLVMAAIPTISILELVQRGKVITTLAGLYSLNELGMNLATASVWVINLVLPAVAGSLLILRMRKIMNMKNETI